MAENIRRALIEDVSSELRGLEETRFRGSVPPMALFIPLINEAVGTMDRKGADSPENYERAREGFVELVRRARTAARDRGATGLEPEDLQVALRGFCPRWPIC